MVEVDQRSPLAQQAQRVGPVVPQGDVEHRDDVAGLRVHALQQPHVALDPRHPPRGGGMDEAPLVQGTQAVGVPVEHVNVHRSRFRAG